MRVIGIDPGTISIDLCGLDDGRVFLDRALPTSEALRSPDGLVELLSGSGADLIAGPSGYGLPLVDAAQATGDDLRLACLMPEGEPGGIGGLRRLLKALRAVRAPVVLTPGVIHLPTVPAYRKVNRVDMGTADKLCAVVLAVHEQAQRRGCAPREVSLLLVELGGAFSAVVAVERGKVIDGAGGSSGPLGARAAGALDGEVAFLMGTVTKDALFAGGASTIAGPAATDWPCRQSAREALAADAFLDSTLKHVAAMISGISGVREIVLSGRLSLDPRIVQPLTEHLQQRHPGIAVHRLVGFASQASHAAQGAALLAEGLAGGRTAPLVEALAIRQAAGTVLDHLYVADEDAARQRIGLSAARRLARE